ncbi:MAG: hypothetical protein RI973_1476 [Bacteroidota bacterium]|jgi:hypothetical protein
MGRAKNQRAASAGDSFKLAVEATADVGHCYKPGLKALGAHSGKVMPAVSRFCSGSVDLDLCTHDKYPSDPRWDYILGYEGKAYFVEVHPAQSSEVPVVVKKLNWLKNWLELKAPEIKAIKASLHPFVWLQTNGMHLLRETPQYRAAAQHGILPRRVLRLQ